MNSVIEELVDTTKEMCDKLESQFTLLLDKQSEKLVTNHSKAIAKTISVEKSLEEKMISLAQDQTMLT